ncbi:Uncharacterised protein [Actinobacillus lignieresii]|uniref:hypothetical protein n=1 Tax=Actinobacillus lignieresii TaxID=720 RepID=UPI000F6C0A01|nr:hypothetical protein [Actinobacillus lignieresii]VEB25749.1 Uncharacterised protein [Actinobacillus lignieresii]
MKQSEEQDGNKFDIAKFGKVIIWFAFLGYMAWNYWGKDFFGLPKCDAQQSIQTVINLNKEIYKEKFEIKGLSNIYETGFNEQNKIRFCRATVEMVSLPSNFPFPTDIKYTIEDKNGEVKVHLLAF